MRGINTRQELIRKLATEGDYHIYSLLGLKKRPFLLLKLYLITVKYLSLTGLNTFRHENIVFIKGANQQRLYNHYKNKIDKDIGPHQLIKYDDIPKYRFCFSLKRIVTFLHFLGIFILIAATGKKEYLNNYLLKFNCLLSDYVKNQMPLTKSFICFNDQPFDMVSFILNLHQQNNCQTAVVQHGLILTEKFYFPTHVKQFWAWGPAARAPFQRYNSDAELVVKGRYTRDFEDKKQDYIDLTSQDKLSILIAPSFFHNEVKDIINIFKNCNLLQSSNVVIKFHPATKLKMLLRLWIKLHWPSIRETSQDMEILSEVHHILITKNSTSALDFMLRGKPVFFTEIKESSFPQKDYAFSISELEQFFMSEDYKSAKNKARLQLIKGELNV